MENNTVFNYGVVKDESDDRWAIHIESGDFADFIFKIDHLCLTYKTDDDRLKLVESYDEVDDKDVILDFQYDLTSVPKNFENVDGSQQAFENVARNILIDILMSHPELYKLESNNEHQADIEQPN